MKYCSVYVRRQLCGSRICSGIQRKEFWEECKYISQKGIYCYDIWHKSEFMNEYIYVCKPSLALAITDLPQDIQSVLSRYRMEKANFAGDEIITIQ